MSPRPPHNVNPTFSCYLKYHRDTKLNETLSPVLACYFCLWFLSFWLVRRTLCSFHCAASVRLIWCVCMFVAEAWHFNCASNQIGREAARKVGEWWGVRGCSEGCRPTVTMVNHFCQNHQGHNCWPAVLWDFWIAYSIWTWGFLFLSLRLSSFLFFTQVPSLRSVLPLSFLILPFCPILICPFLCFHVPICVTTLRSFASPFLPYLKLTNCAIMRPVVLRNPLCMACAGSESEHGLFWVIIIQFANTQPLCESGVRGDGMIKYWGRARQLQLLAVMCERMNVMTSMFKHSCGEESLGGLFINTNMSSSPRCRHCWCKHDNNREERN